MANIVTLPPLGKKLPQQERDMWEIVMLLALGAGGAWVWSGITAREPADAAARRACERHGQQLLDETVAQVSVQLQRSASGSVLPRRTYRFEFTGDGDARRSGELAIYGGRVVDLHLSLEEFTLFDHGDAVAEQDVTAVDDQLKQNE
jgi:hypothetical protein